MAKKVFLRDEIGRVDVTGSNFTLMSFQACYPGNGLNFFEVN